MPSLGRVISFRLPVFPFLRWTLIRIKTKPTALVLLVGQILATKQVCDFQRFRIVLLVSLHDVKTHSEARKTVLNFQRRFGCFIG
ncbi:hypothetical protein J4727_20500 [Providencia rettgeri]|uniref:Uncharacterized protein n=1 Tax=Providencia rettgeri TaxID=587 RepID=A0A939NDD0_PRORE|nr:hypothetical protein [Providencia rettgeri]